MEVKFIALPSTEQLRQHTGMLKDHHEDAGVFKCLDATLSRYEQAQWRIYHAQRKAAVIAAEILRPRDMEGPRLEKQHAMQMARAKYEDAALAVFSDTCTKGL